MSRHEYHPCKGITAQGTWIFGFFRGAIFIQTWNFQMAIPREGPPSQMSTQAFL